MENNWNKKAEELLDNISKVTKELPELANLAINNLPDIIGGISDIPLTEEESFYESITKITEELQTIDFRLSEIFFSSDYFGNHDFDLLEFLNLLLRLQKILNTVTLELE